MDLISHFQKYNIEPLNGTFQFEILDSTIERFTVQAQSNGIQTHNNFLIPSQGYLRANKDILLGVFNGKIDPMAAIGADFCYFDANGRASKEFDANELRMLTLLLQSFNCHHVSSRFQDHLFGRVYRTGKFIDSDGKEMIPGPWPVTAAIGETLFNICSKPEIRRTLEIGFAYGVSAMFICEAHRNNENGLHTAIDPWQESFFQNIGLHNIKTSKLEDFFELKDRPDWFVLPELLKQNENFDLVFIDGLHSFDVVMLDFFYADLLLHPGGYLIFDDISFPGVAPAVDYVLRNRAYQEIERRFDRLLILQKIRNDHRTTIE